MFRGIAFCLLLRGLSNTPKRLVLGLGSLVAKGFFRVRLWHLVPDMCNDFQIAIVALLGRS